MLTHTYIVIGDCHDEDVRDLLARRIQRGFPGTVTLHNSAWVLFTSMNASEIRDQLGAGLAAADRLFVAGLSEQGAWQGYAEPEAGWLGRLFNPFD